MNNEFYQSPRSTKIMRLFWKAAGADRYILERSTYSDQIKYVCLGGIIIATGVMAAIAGGYAFYTIFAPKGNAIDSFKTVQSVAGNYDPTDIPTALISIVFGLIWGLIIFNIDRFIVTSTGKGDGTEAITKKELVGALPRIIMGAIIAMTISKPVEIRMFKTEIDVALFKEQQEARSHFLATEQLRYDKLVNDLDAKNSRMLDYIQKMESQELEAREQIREQTNGEKGNSPGFGARAKENERQADYLHARIENIKQGLAYKAYFEEKNRLTENHKSLMKQADKSAAGLDGLLERIKLAHEQAGWIISGFITLLFMTIELTPIFFKLMLIKSPYDYMEENIKDLIKAENGIEIEYDFYEDGEGRERDKTTFHQVIKALKEKVKILEAQSELSSSAIDAWKSRKMEEINEDPANFIKED